MTRKPIVRCIDCRSPVAAEDVTAATRCRNCEILNNAELPIEGPYADHLREQFRTIWSAR